MSELELSTSGSVYKFKIKDGDDPETGAQFIRSKAGIESADEKYKAGIGSANKKERFNVEIIDYHGIDMSDRGYSLAISDQVLEFSSSELGPTLGLSQSDLIGSGETHTIPVDEIRTDEISSWKREDLRYESFWSSMDWLGGSGGEFRQKKHQYVVKIPFGDESFVTVGDLSILGGGTTKDHMNFIRKLRDVTGVPIDPEKNPSREPQKQPEEIDSTPEADPIEQIERLQELKKKGAITEQEFEKKKSDLLDDI